MATRRPHRKSRAGCQECKRRRIKCDESRPQCSRCVRYEIPCVYASKVDTPSTNSRSTQSSPRVASPQQVAPRSEVGFLDATFDSSSADALSGVYGTAELALHHHWTITTSKSIVNTHELDHLWQKLFPEIGFKHVYVTYSILSLTALHIAYLNPTEGKVYTREAARYHDKALRGFMEDFRHIGTHNCEAIFSNSILSFFYAFLTFGGLEGSHTGNTESATARTAQVLGSEWIPMIRGVQAVLNQFYGHIRLGPLNILTDLGNWDTVLDTHPMESDEQFKRIAQTWQGSQDTDVYDEALYLLRKCHAFMAQFKMPQAGEQLPQSWGYNRDWSGPFAWLITVSEQYIVLQRQRQPPALIIFAFFGGLLHQLDGYWWMEGCGKSIVQAVDGCLGPYWSQWIAWPKEVLGLG